MSCGRGHRVAAVADSLGARMKTVWILERRLSDAVVYWGHFADFQNWTLDASAAVHFSDQRSALLALGYAEHRSNDPWVAVEHGFCDANDIDLFKVGDIIRHDFGRTALMEVEHVSVNKGRSRARYYGTGLPEQFSGNTTVGVYHEDAKPASALDLRVWDQERKKKV